MRKQLIVKIPEDESIKDIEAILNLINQSYALGYPMPIFPGWEYEIVELSEPMLIMNTNSDSSYDKILKTLRNK